MAYSTVIAATGEHVLDIPDEDCLFRVEASDDNGRTYTSNGLRFPTQDEAHAWAWGLACRWFGCTNIRVVREADGEVVEQTL